MRLEGRRESSNVDDRRGRSGGTGKLMAGGGGLVAIVIGILFTIMQGGDPTQAILGAIQENVFVQTENNQELSPEQEELATFSKKILASTEDVWTAEFKKMGKEYIAPKMVLYTGSVQTECGNGQASMGPFYCSGDQTVYIDLSFFSDMKKDIGADGDFAYAYVIAHEVGHHVQNLLGRLNDTHMRMNRVSKTEANKLSVRLELEADFYAGFWGYHEQAMFGSLEPGDADEALNCAKKIGDNYLQEKARGYSTPESFTHGTSQQRSKWLKLGLSTGDLRQDRIFELSESQL